MKQWVILKLEDDWMLYRDSDKYHRRWQERCSNCLAPCCLVGMGGYPYDYEMELDQFDDKQVFFSNGFIIMTEDDLESGFNDNMDENDAYKLNVCPLNVAGECLIYEDRPSVCRDWKCVMATKTYIGGGKE